MDTICDEEYEQGEKDIEYIIKNDDEDWDEECEYEEEDEDDYDEDEDENLTNTLIWMLEAEISK